MWWLCKCDCGKVVEVRANRLVANATKSCGCLIKDTMPGLKHGKEGTKIYLVWHSMKNRCLNEKTSNWSRYGGRGISICKQWLEFEQFYADMGDPPNNFLSLDRIDNDGDYTPDNCRWATREEQQNNRKNTIFIPHQGMTLSLAQWGKKLGIAYPTLYSRLSRGATGDALFKTIRSGRSV